MILFRISWPLAAVVALLALAGPSYAGHHHRHHRPGCNTARCDWWADRAFAHKWALEHAPRVSPTRFELCVANRENGEPGSLAAGSINWRANNAYEGAFSWEPSKWAAGGGLRFAPHAYEASEAQQLLVFRQNGRNGEWTPGNWPTIPACLGV